jgi:hypothetical protein
MRLKVIACDALRREICAAAERSPHRTELEFLPSHHVEGPELLDVVQKVVDRASGAPHDAIVLAYALCGGGVAGLESRGIRLVIPRKRECLGFPGSDGDICFRSTGWTPGGLETIDETTLQEVRAEDGTMPHFSYRQLTYVSTAPGRQSTERAAREFQAVRRDLRLFDRLLSGVWVDSEVLVVPAGWRVCESVSGLGRERIA